jgi:type II secretory pathway component PulK
MRARGREGFVLVVVLVFALLLAASIAAFLRRATVDAMIVRHRNAAAEAEAAARGGVRLAITLLLEDRLQEVSSQFRSESLQDVWALASGNDLPVGEGITLRLRIEDAGARLNLNALFEKGKPRKYSEIFLSALLEHVIDEMPGRAESKRYEPAKLARSFLDYVDEDETAIEGGAEDEAYARRDVPAKVPNRPLLSLDELRGVEGFDAALVEGLAPYVTVYPWVRGDGLNPNTAPPHVLALLFHGVGGDFELAREEEIKTVLKARDDGDILCADEAGTAACRKIGETIPGEIFPPPSYVSDVFLVRAEARVGEIRRVIETVVDRSKPSEPQLLAWKVR